MAKSMTAFGRARKEINGKIITVEIKSVNSRYFDPQVKISRAYSPLEERLKSKVQSYISRGKTDISLNVEFTEKSTTSISLDTKYAENYIAALKELRDEFNLIDDISVMTVAQNKDVFSITVPEADLEKMWEEVAPVVDEAALAFDAMRCAEGERLHSDLIKKKNNILLSVDKIEELSRNSISGYKDKFEARIKKIIGDSGIEIDQQRILTECAIYADKVSIDEEIVRLRSHFTAFDEIFESNEPIGRKLDFLVQEMNRETNTIGSKCTDSSIAHIVVDVKNEIEKIREQIQNLE
jgi:uncharacterized protein (TIGR00255 family)